MNVKNNFILKASLGFSIGIFVGIFITAITGVFSSTDGNIYLYNTVLANRIGNLIVSFCIELLCYGILGVVGMGGMALTYENEKCNLLMATIIHFTCVIITFTVIGLYLSWIVPSEVVANVIFYGCFIGAYVLIWLIQSIIYKKQIKEINMGIKRIKSR